MDANKNNKDFFKNINKSEDYINLLNEYKKKESSKSKISLRNVLNSNKKFKNVYNLINNDINQNDNNNNINTLLIKSNAINKLNDTNYIKKLFHKNETKKSKGYIFLANKQNDNTLLDVEYDKNNLLSINNNKSNKNNLNEISSYSYRMATPYKNANQNRYNTYNNKNRSSRNFNNKEFVNKFNNDNTNYINDYNNNFRRPGLYFINLKKENSKDLKKFSDFSVNFDIFNEKGIKKWINKEKYIHNTDYNQEKKEELNSLFQQTQVYNNNENNLRNNNKIKFEKDENVKQFQNEFNNLKNNDKKYLKANTNRISYENNPLYKNEILTLSNKLKTIDLFLKFKNKKKINKNNFYI